MTMSQEVLEEVLATFLKTKGAVKAFLKVHSNISQSELVELASAEAQILKSQRAMRTRAKKDAKLTKEIKAQVNTKDFDKLLYTARTLALVGIPHTRTEEQFLKRQVDLPDGRRVWVTYRTADPSITLPYGRDRALLTYLMTCARHNHDPRVEFRSALDFLKAFDLAISGASYRQINESMKRIANVVISYGYDAETHSRDRGNKLITEKCLPNQRDVKVESTGLQTLPGIGNPYYIIFDQTTFLELVNHPVRLPLAVAKKFTGMPFGWDFLQFVSYQSDQVGGDEPKIIPLSLLKNFLGSSETNDRKIRWRLEKVLSELGEYFAHVHFEGSGSKSFLIIEKPAYELSEDDQFSTPVPAISDSRAAHGSRKKKPSTEPLEGEVLEMEP